MYEKNQRPSEIIARQRRVIEQQDSIIGTLKAALAAARIDQMPTYAPWMSKLTPQERALVSALYSAHPRTVDKYDLLEMLPGLDHALERQVQVVSVRVHHVRKKLGRHAIENVRGVGYRLGRDLYNRMKDAGPPSADAVSAA